MEIQQKNDVATISRVHWAPGKFPTSLEHSQETIFLASISVKSEILNYRPVTLEERDSFVKAFLKLSKF